MCIRVRAYAHRAQQKRPNDPNVIDTLAETYYLNGHFKQAIETQKRSLLPGVKGACAASYLKRQLHKYEAAYEDWKRPPVETE